MIFVPQIFLVVQNIVFFYFVNYPLVIDCNFKKYSYSNFLVFCISTLSFGGVDTGWRGENLPMKNAYQLILFFIEDLYFALFFSNLNSPPPKKMSTLLQSLIDRKSKTKVHALSILLLPYSVYIFIVYLLMLNVSENNRKFDWKFREITTIR